MFGERMDFIERMMDYSAIKRNAISDNIANYSTPEYKATKVDFELALDNVKKLDMNHSREKHIDTSIGRMGEIKQYKDYSTKARVDGNNVDLTLEMIEMIKNNSAYTKAVTGINHQFSLLKTAMGPR